MATSLYKIALNYIYEEYVLDKAYNGLLKAQRPYASLEVYNEEFKTYSLNLGRRRGSTTALLSFIENHPEISFLLVSTNVYYNMHYRPHLSEAKNIKLCTSELSLRLHLYDADIVLFDSYNLLKSNHPFNNIDNFLFSEMNRRSRNQIYVRFQ